MKESGLTTDLENALAGPLETIAKQEGLKEWKTVVTNVEPNGFLGRSGRILLEGETEKGEVKAVHLFLKYAPSQKGHQGKFSYLDLYNNEIFVYDEMFPEFFKLQQGNKVTEPFLYVAKYYASGQIDRSPFIILEDLNKKGYVLWDRRRPMTHEMIEMNFKGYGRYHALSHAIRTQKPREFEKLAERLKANMLLKFLDASDVTPIIIENCEKAMNCLDPEKDKHALQVCKGVLGKRIRKFLAEFPFPENINEAVIVHGDCWCNNYMFLFEDQQEPSIPLKVVFLDWQLTSLSSPVTDLSYFFYLNSSKEGLENLSHYLKVYYNSFSRNMTELGLDPEKVFSFSTLQKHWYEYSLIGLILACTGNYLNCVDTTIPDLSVTSFKDACSVKECTPGQQEQYKNYQNRVRSVLLHFVNNKIL